MTNLFDRRVAITVNDLKFVNDVSPDGSPAIIIPFAPGRVSGSLKMSFKVERSLGSEGNKAQAQLFNLKEDSRGKITVEKPQFLIEAGYRDTQAIIFQGTAVEIMTTRESTGYVTSVSAKDGFDALRARVSVSLGANATVGDAIMQSAKAMKLTAQKSFDRAKAGDFDGAFSTFVNGMTMSGKASTEMNKLGRANGFDWSIQNEELLILKPEEVLPIDAILVSPLTGLITSPVRVLDENRPKALIVRAQSLLNPGIMPGRIVTIESNEVSGQFKTEKVTHTGDTDGSTWFSDFEGIEI